MKELYEELELEILRFRMADIITTSDARDEDDDMDDEPDDGDDDTGDDDTGSDDTEGTAGTYCYGPGDVRSETHVLTPTPENDYHYEGEEDGEHFTIHWPAYVDENGNPWLLINGAYIKADNPDNFV